MTNASPAEHVKKTYEEVLQELQLMKENNDKCEEQAKKEAIERREASERKGDKETCVDMTDIGNNVIDNCMGLYYSLKKLPGIQGQCGLSPRWMLDMTGSIAVVYRCLLLILMLQRRDGQCRM